MPGVGSRPDAAAMISATEEFWDFERASYDDELDAWRERTAASFATFPPAAVSSSSGHPEIVGGGPRIHTWSSARRQATRQGRPARTPRKAARVRIQRSAHDRMTGLLG
jgi:hypothetical protein